MPSDLKTSDRNKPERRWLFVGLSAAMFISLLFAGIYFYQFRKTQEHKAELARLWSNGKYEEGFLYVSHLGNFGIKENLRHFYSGAFLAGLNKLTDAKKELDAAGNIPEFSREISKLQTEIQHRLSTRQYTAFYDRQNLALVSRSFDGSFHIIYDSIVPVIRNSNEALLRELPANRQSSLTIDYRIQIEAQKALGNYAGAIVVLDPIHGDILAAADNWNGVGSSYPFGTSLALNHQYEPGSIIKMITFAGAAEKGMNPQKLFPMICDGKLMLSNHQEFHDWIPHGDLKDFETASAVSCNIGFAKMGLAMKPEDLFANLKRFGFDDRLKNGAVSVDLGKIKNSEMSDLYVCDLSIGLDYLEMTPLHMAMVASAIANDGVSISPRLLLHDRNVIGTSYGSKQVVPFRRFMSVQTAKMVKKAMEYVVLYEEGTGRRARISDFPFAIKTGTAGEGAYGYNAMIMGFAPSEKPKIAFAIVAEHSGKAEYEAARITKLFLESIRGYI